MLYYLLLALILLMQVVILAAIIIMYLKVMRILNGHEHITIGWRNILHDARDVLNAAKMWMYVGEQKDTATKEATKVIVAAAEKTTIAAEKTTVAIDKIEQVVKSNPPTET